MTEISQDKYLDIRNEEWGYDPSVLSLDSYRYLKIITKPYRFPPLLIPAIRRRFARRYDGYNVLGFPYDFCSVMHGPLSSPGYDYDRTPLVPYNCTETVGYATHLSELDVLKINKLYNCSA